MINHLRLKHKKEHKEVLLNASGNATTPKKRFEKNNFNEKLLKFVISTDQAFTIVENKALRELLNSAQNKPSDYNVGRAELGGIRSQTFNKMKSELVEVLTNNTSQISLSLDCWTSPNQIAFLGVIAHFVDEKWELQNIMLDLIPIEGVSHTGVNLATALGQLLDEFHLWKKLNSITSDNASNMGTLFSELEKLARGKGVKFSASNNRVRCLAHVINLACQEALKILDKSEEAKGDNTAALKRLLKKSEPLPLISRVRKIMQSLKYCSLKRSFLKEKCNSTKTSFKLPKLDIKTRWNSTLEMLERAQFLKNPLNSTISSFASLKEFGITSDAWMTIDQIIKLLQPFRDATKHMSVEKVPTLADTVVAYNALFDHLEAYNPDGCSTTYRSSQDLSLDSPASEAFLPSVVEAAVAAWVKLNEYYPTADGLVYSVGTGK